MFDVEIRAVPFREMSPREVYEVLRLRVDVFVVEQQAAYPELDGRDTEAGTRHLWVERDGDVLAYLRLLEEPDGAVRIGRVCTDRAARGLGLARRLMEYALTLAGGRVVVLGAQAHLHRWYADVGFRRDGPEYVEDGILHVPMRRDP